MGIYEKYFNTLLEQDELEAAPVDATPEAENAAMSAELDDENSNL